MVQSDDMHRKMAVKVRARKSNVGRLLGLKGPRISVDRYPSVWRGGNSTPSLTVCVCELDRLSSVSGIVS